MKTVYRLSRRESCVSGAKDVFCVTADYVVLGTYLDSREAEEKLLTILEAIKDSGNLKDYRFIGAEIEIEHS